VADLADEPPPPVGRARDGRGRPRNPRQRDRLGRPLPPGGSALSDPDRQPVEPIPDELDLSPGQALDLAQRLLDEGRAFGAHEVLEAVWKAAPAGERELWRSLAQLAVGVTHLERGNPAGACALLRRGAGGLVAYRGQAPATAAPHGIGLSGLVDTALAVAAEVEQGRDVTVPRLQLRGQ
jgi:hypothetical protein